MRLLIQRVSHAEVEIKGEKKSGINEGLLLLVGIEEADEEEDIDFLCKKTINLRIFDDENGVMNRSVMDIEGYTGSFTIHTPCKYEKENRPSYLRAAKPIFLSLCMKSFAKH